MRVVLDFQACQSASRYRGIGRGSWSLMIGMAKILLDRDHEVICLLSNGLEQGLEHLSADILEFAPGVRIVCFNVPSPCAAYDECNAWRQMAARMLREQAIACLEPDFVHIPALLADGWGDDAVGSIGELGVYVPVSITQHDLIPMAMSELYMPPGRFHDYYMKKLEGVKSAALFLAISEYSRQEAIKLLELHHGQIVNISSAAGSVFLNQRHNETIMLEALKNLGLSPGFLLYVPGGFDPRKNMERLLKSYASLPSSLRDKHPLVVGSKLEIGIRESLETYAHGVGLDQTHFILTGYVSDEDLVHLYRGCLAYVFPSLHEGFGLPVLEAMACGAAVIASNRTSIPEVVGLDDALFDPYSESSMAAKMRKVIEDPVFRQYLKKHAGVQSKKFSWGASAKVAVDAIEDAHFQLKQRGWSPYPKESLPSCDEMLEILHRLDLSVMPDANDLLTFRMCYQNNLKEVQA